MDQEHENNLSPEENAWLDEILPPEDLGEELGPHESVEDAGLVSPDKEGGCGIQYSVTYRRKIPVFARHMRPSFRQV